MELHSPEAHSAQPTTDGANPQESLGKISAGSAALLLGVIYGLGFLVSNAHLEKYEVLTFELVRVRYFAAALLFLLLTVVPMGLAIMAFGQFNSDLEKWRVRRFELGGISSEQLVSLSIADAFRTRSRKVVFSVGWTAMWMSVVAGLFALFVAWGGWWLAVWRLQIEPGFASSRTAVAYFLFVILLGAGGYVALRHSIPDGAGLKGKLLNVRHSHLDNWAYYLFAFAGLAVYFGQSMYPHLRPAYGGGGAWAAIITADTAEIPTEVRGPLSGQLAILDQDGDYMRVVACTGHPLRRSSTQAFELPRKAVLVARIDSIVSLPSFQQWCAERAKPPRPTVPVQKRATNPSKVAPNRQ